MGEIARWTTPVISYKPEKATADEIVEIKCVLTQSGADLIIKSKADAIVDEGRFLWSLSQRETARLCLKTTMLQFDYTTVDGNRYTTIARPYHTTNSAIDEEI